MKTMKWTLLLAFFAIWACQEEQFSQEEIGSNSYPSPQVDRLRTIKRVDNAPATRAVSVKDKLWQPGDTIRIKFQNADEYPDMPVKVIQYAAIWLQYAYLHFEYVDKEEEADVKIGFNMDTRELAWSTIGTDCKQVPQDEVSLNFYDLEYEEESGIKSEILKGFGHILGLGFEHKNPNDDQLVFINDEVKDYYNLSDQDVIELTQLYNTDQTNYTDYDPESIMTLEIPKKILTKPTQKYRTYRNNELSSLDTIHIAELYPFPVEPEPVDSCIAVINIHQSTAFIYALIKSDIEIDWGNGIQETLSAQNSGGRPIGALMTYIEDNYTIKIFGTDSAIRELSVECYNVKNLDISKNKYLERLFCQQCNLYNIDISKNSKLKELYCGYNNLDKLDISNNKELETLDCAKNNINHIDLHENNKLQELNVSENKLTELNTENLLYLQYLNASDNRLSSINVHNNLNLWALYIKNNNIETLDITNNQKLSELGFDNNNISYIDLSNNLVLESLTCKNNRLTTLNINGLNLLQLDFQINPISYQETKNIFTAINDRTHTVNGRIRFPLYCYRDSLTYCDVYDNHAKCDRKEITHELAELFKTKYWIYADENNWPIPYTNDQLQNFEIEHSNFRKNIWNKNYFQQLRIERFGYNRLLQ